LLVDRLDPSATVDDSLVTLPAGARSSFLVRSAAHLSTSDLIGATVLRTANDLRAHPVAPTVQGVGPPATLG
jgi:beta-mannosidase